MYYRFIQESNRCILTEKSTTPITGSDILTSEEDFDLRLYEVLIGFYDDKKVILKYVKKLKPAEAIESYVNDMKTEIASANEKITTQGMIIDNLMQDIIPSIVDMIP